MKVFVVGAHGQIGSILVDQLLARGDEVVAGIRNDDQAAEFTEKGAMTAHLDLTAQPEEMATAFDGSDAIIFVAGSGGSTGYDMTLLVDLDGAIQAMNAARIAHVKRFIIVSAMNAETRNKWSDTIRPYYVAKHYADDYLMNQTDLDYTIVKPGLLTNDDPEGGIQTGADEGSITRTDVAAVLAAAVHNPETIKKSFAVVNGTMPIDKALQNL
ncbi:SDR family oxidoreductase [Pediococcus argentinicus]|uniref:NAD(P)-binding domain-containing protein n=1 Tax=Pediococcus argentinicus TaxID=480391 RepID=A0A0R2NL66_9LACO|nr:SDR family oxidoreductase [Pediococcus argentinicus]KRO26076.1 hypothetical protein IV88_GL000991 [Pediococcus argentinicus]NKZ21738.1 SDR family oxidoreductase [Pediococcus argentinicus]GEP18901.1 short-chain dehydrogenase [Pediococcus argentinicus]